MSREVLKNFDVFTTESNTTIASDIPRHQERRIVLSQNTCLDKTADGNGDSFPSPIVDWLYLRDMVSDLQQHVFDAEGQHHPSVPHHCDDFVSQYIMR